MMPHLQNQYQPMQPQMHPQTQHTYSQYASSYPPPPWEVTSGYGNYQNPGLYMNTNYQGNMSNGSLPVHGPYSTHNVNDFHYPQYGNQSMYSTTQNSANFIPTQTNPLLQQSNSFQNPHSPSMNGNTASSIRMQGPQSLQHNNSFPSKASNSSVLNGATIISNGSTGISSGQAPFLPSYDCLRISMCLVAQKSSIKMVLIRVHQVTFTRTWWVEGGNCARPWRDRLLLFTDGK
ncbi:hypothetical protein RND81_07G005300 [Saponaria officinalis]|uniref:Uncharacterized protein n=1 Tax=Saponaria officinalis TaxID=3572 RepID=A0AAW1JKP1_SAPOF